MALFNFKSSNEITGPSGVNSVVGNGYFCGSYHIGGKGGKWSAIYIDTIIRLIMNGLHNVAFKLKNDSDENVELTKFLTDNIQDLVWLMMNNGFIIVEKNRRGRYYIPDYSTVERNIKGEVTNYNCVYYSLTYRLHQTNDFSTIKPYLKVIDEYMDAQSAVTGKLGGFTILTGKGMPTNPIEKEEFKKEFNSMMGLSSDKNNLIVTTAPLDATVVSFPIDKLGLPDRIKDAYTAIANYFCVPIDLLFGQSTYSNSEQALRNFYANCISPLAECVLEVGKYIIRNDATNLTFSGDLTFTIDNVPEIRESNRVVDTEYVRNLQDNIRAQEEMGEDATHLKKLLSDYIYSL